MAWFSVHESIYGPKLRDMYHCLKCSEFEAVGILIALWSWGLPNAEKDGYLPYTGKEELARYLYSKGAGSKLNPDDVVQALISSGWLDETERGIFIHDWDTWQEQWYKAREKRENDARRKRESRRKAGETSLDNTDPEPPEDQEDGEAQDQKPTPSKQEAKYGKEFEQFWTVYPRKIDKGAAYKKYHARRKDGFSAEELLLAAQNYADRCRKLKTEPNYIKHAKTFLSDTTPFTDYLPKQSESDQASEPDTRNPFTRYMEDA